MKYRKNYISGCCVLDFDTESDRDTAAKMIEAMAWWANVGGDVIDNVHDDNAPATRYCYVTIAGYKGGVPIEDTYYGPTPWGAILAAKKVSES